MANRHLATYLNDHLAGSTLALELLAHVERTHSGSPLGSFAGALWAEITADRQELESLLAWLHISQSLPRRAAAWLTEKVTELKLRLEDPSGGALRLLEILDTVSIGIEGKRLLWRSLSAAAADSPELRGPDYGRLEERAEEQRRAVETVRLEAAKAALGSVPSTTAASR